MSTSTEIKIKSIPYDVDKLRGMAKKMLLARNETPTAQAIYKVMIILRRKELKEMYGKR